VASTFICDEVAAGEPVKRGVVGFFLASAALLGAQQSRIDPAVAPIRVISFITELPARRGDAVLHGPIHGNCNKLRARATSAVKRPLIEPFCGCDSVNYLSANKIPGGFSVHFASDDGNSIRFADGGERDQSRCKKTQRNDLRFFTGRDVLARSQKTFFRDKS
jgi:hypothetical protein